MFKLVISDDEGKQTVVPLVRDEITVGRKEGNTIRLTERNVSRRHARLIKSNGKFIIEDLQSYNGVHVNGQRIGSETSLDPGDLITIGDYMLALEVDQVEPTLPDRISPATANADTTMLASPGPPARLVMITPPAPGAEFALTSDRVRIGRAEDLDIWVNHRSISREHAEIQREASGGVRLIDLRSANGVRVNGNDIQNELLSPGDVVELGQVRFRFVGAGEHYAFDADRTLQMDAVTVEPRGGSRIPFAVAGGILLLSVVGAAGVAFWGGETEPRPVVRAEPVAPGPPRTPLDAVDRYESALSACRVAVERNDFEEARAQARLALEVRPGDEAAARCQLSAEASPESLEVFERGVRHFEVGRLAEAYQAFDSLPEDSPLRERSEVRRAIRSYAGMKLHEGESALREDPAAAGEIAEFVLAMVGLTPEQQARADQLRRDAEGGGDARPRETSRPPLVASVHRPAVRPRGAASQARPRPAGARSASAEPAETSHPTEVTANPPANSAGAGSLDDQVRACVMRGDNACVIRLLEGRARSQVQLGQLIEAYRARGQTNEAIRHMRTFVQRYRGTSRAHSYQQILARHQ